MRGLATPRLISNLLTDRQTFNRSLVFSKIRKACQLLIVLIILIFLIFRHIITGSYNNFFRTFLRNSDVESTYEASVSSCNKNSILRSKKVGTGKKRKDEISADSLDFSKKILHCTWHPKSNIIALAATNNLYIFQG
jgi:hypothetical protein